MLSERAIEEFKGIYLQVYGVVLTDADATEKATGLFALYKTVFSNPRKMNMRNGHEEKIQSETDQK